MPTTSIKRYNNENSGKLKNIKFEITLAGIDSKSIRNVQVFASFDYNLMKKLKIEMSGLMHIDIDTPNGASKTFVDGFLRLVFDKPVLIDSKTRNKYKQDPLATVQYEKNSLPEIFTNYNDRTGKCTLSLFILSVVVERTKFDYKYIVQPVGSRHKTFLSIDVRVPLQEKVDYIPGVLESMKGMWVQYIALLLPTIYVFNKIMGFLFRHQFLETSVTSDLVPRKKR